MAFAPSMMQVSCPNCGSPARARVYHIIDAAEQPELKEALLAGQLNLFQCPSCGAAGAMDAPLVYHDPEKELLLAYVPMGLNLGAQDEERFIAQATNAILNNTPQEQRKGYLLRPPTRAISLQGLAETILEADGISRDELRKQTERIRLISTLADLAYNDEKLKAAVQEHRELIDRQFLMLIGATMEAAAQQHDEETVERYSTLREKVIEFAGIDPKDVPSLGVEGIYEQVLEGLRASPPEELQAAVSANRPYLDYGFFLFLSQKMDEATGTERQELEVLRGELLRLTEEMDSEAKEAMARASQQLNEILRSDDLDEAIHSRLDSLDEAFLVVLQANIEAAQQQKREDIMQVLVAIYQKTIQLLQEKLRPELRLINEMLQKTAPADREPLIAEALETYNPAGFLEVLQTIADDAEAQGMAAPLVARLREIEDQVAAAVEAKRSGVAPKKKSSLIWTPGDDPQPGGDRPSIIIPGR